MTDTQQLPPHSLESEEATIGSLLLDGKAIGDASFLKPEDFYHEPTRLTFQACLDVESRGEGINQITIAQELDRQGLLETIGGAAYLSHTVTVVPG